MAHLSPAFIREELTLSCKETAKARPPQWGFYRNEFCFCLKRNLSFNNMTTQEQSRAADETIRGTFAVMNLDQTQRQKVAEWIAQGQKLSEIQSRLASELGVKMTYMDVRLLVDDLKLTPKDADRPKSGLHLNVAPVAPPAAGRPPSMPAEAEEEVEPAARPNVSVKVDQIARPGSVVSGKVTFSDGNSADWYFDQTGRLGLIPQAPGYRPKPTDLQEFQAVLDGELSRMGF